MNQTPRLLAGSAPLTSQTPTDHPGTKHSHGLRTAAVSGLLALLCLLLAGCNLNPDVAKRKYVENGNKYFARGKYREAFILYRSAINKDRRYGEAYYRLGLAELRLKRFSGAVYALLRAVELQPENDDAKIKLADLFLLSYVATPAKRTEIAREIQRLIDPILKKNPQSFDAARIRGQLAFLERDYQRAVAELEAADQIRPWDPNVGLALCQALLMIDQFSRCEAHAWQLVQRHPSFEAVYTLLYRSYANRGRMVDAARVLEEKVSRLFQDSRNILQLAYHYYSTGDRESAVRTVNRLLANRRLFPNANRLAGEFYMQVGEVGAALELFREGARTSTGAEKLEYEKRIVEVMLGTGNVLEARRLLGGLMQQHPSDAELQALRASLVLSSGTALEVEEEIRRLEQLVRRTPANPSVRYQLGRAYWLRNRLEAALEQLGEAARLSPQFAGPRIAMAQIYLNSRDSATALKLAEEALRLVPGDPRARMLFASALRAGGRRREAAEQLRLTAKLYPTLIDAWLQLAWVELEEGNGETARQIFRECYQKTQTAACLAGEAEALISMGQRTKSLELLQAELAARPNDRELKLAVAGLFQKLKMFPRARAIYEELLIAEPLSSEVRFALGTVLLAMGEPSAALVHLRIVAARDSNNPHVLHQLAGALIALGENSEALQVCEVLLKLRPDDPVVLNNTAFLLAETGGDLNRALSYAQRAVRAIPSAEEFSDTLGWILLKSGLAAEAADIYESLVTAKPSNPTYRYRLGLARFQAGDLELARREIETGIRLGPSQSEAGLMRELLVRLKSGDR